MLRVAISNNQIKKLSRFKKSRFFAVILGFFCLLILAILFSFSMKVSEISLLQVFFDSNEKQMAWNIFIGARLPRVLLGALAGIALASSGVAFQALLRNPLADPYVLGVSGGASLGGVVGLLLMNKFNFLHSFSFISSNFVTVCAFFGALLSMSLIYWIARQESGKLSIYTLLLAGVVFTSFSTALIMFANAFADFQEAHEILYWLMGNLTAGSYSSLFWFAMYVVLGVSILFLQSGAYNAMSRGEETAVQLGVDVEKTKKITFIAASLLVGAVVASCGMIGFVGLIIPHLVRLIIGPDHRLLLPAASLFGGSFLVLTDAFARTVLFPTEIPVGVITALLGGPFFRLFTD